MHSGNVGHAQDLDTLMRAADRLARSRRPRDPDRRVGREARRGHAPGRAPRARQRAVPALSASRAPLGVALERRRPRRRAGAGACGLRGAEPALRHPRGRPPCDRRRRRRERDSPHRRVGKVRHPCAAGVPGSPGWRDSPVLRRPGRSSSRLGRNGREYVEREGDRQRRDRALPGSARGGSQGRDP